MTDIPLRDIISKDDLKYMKQNSISKLKVSVGKRVVEIELENHKKTKRGSKK